MKGYLYLKQLLDFTLSFLMLMALSPLFVSIIIISLFLNGKGPVFYVQERVGFKGKVFLMYKFRTLRTSIAQKGIGHSVDEVTPLGKFLRAYSLDELPQLINICKGEMSFVGPRPLPPAYIPAMHSLCPLRSNVLPGLISLVHLKGRNQLSWRARFILDRYYISHQGPKLDFFILLAIPFVVLSGKGNELSVKLTSSAC